LLFIAALAALAPDQDLQVPAEVYQCSASSLTTVVIVPRALPVGRPVGWGPWSAPPAWDGLFRLLAQEWLGERSATTGRREEIDYATIAEAERLAPK